MPRVSFAPPSLCLAFLPLLDRLLPSLPPTVRDVDVPPLFRERFILSGYRPVGLSLRSYVLSLFQIHNETLNVWSHLLAAICVVMRFMMFTVLQGGVRKSNSPVWAPGIWKRCVWPVWPLTFSGDSGLSAAGSWRSRVFCRCLLAASGPLCFLCCHIPELQVSH